MSTNELRAFNRRVKKWAGELDPMFYKSALAFGYRCDMNTHEITATLRWISDKTRHVHDGRDFVSARTLRRHLEWFEDAGLITVTRHTDDGQNRASTYKVHFDVFGNSDSQPTPSVAPVAVKSVKRKPTQDELNEAKILADKVALHEAMSAGELARWNELYDSLDWSDYL